MFNLKKEVEKKVHAIMMIAVVLSFLGVSTIAYASTVQEGEHKEDTSKIVRFNNENWFTIAHPKVETFSVLEGGEFVGTTTTGIAFEQRNVKNEYGVRIQKFSIQDHYHFIVEGEIAYSLADISAIIAKRM